MARPWAVISSSAQVVHWIDESLARLGVERGAFVGAPFGGWMATHYAMAHPDRVERLALVCPAGIVSSQHARWIVRGLLDVRIRPIPAKIQAFVDSMAMERTRLRRRADPCRPISQQLVVGLATFRRRPREARPVRCNVPRLAGSGIPVLATHRPRRDAARQSEDGRTVPSTPGAQVMLVNDANHLIFIDQQDTVADELQQFLRA